MNKFEEWYEEVKNIAIVDYNYTFDEIDDLDKDKSEFEEYYAIGLTPEEAMQEYFNVMPSIE